jgi:hypothetical protein
MEYTITLTPAQDKALRWKVIDPQKYIEEMVCTRCKDAISEIVKKEVERITGEGGAISGTKFDIVKNAPIKTAKEMTDEAFVEIFDDELTEMSDEALTEMSDELSEIFDDELAEMTDEALTDINVSDTL